MRYERIVFMQGEDADEALAILDEQGRCAAIDYLCQWDCGDGGDIHDEPGNGSSDHVYRKDGYRLSYNPAIGYIGLEREIP